MILDYNLLFTGGTTSPGNSDNATDSPTTGATQASSQVVDLGLTGLPTSASGGGARDIGVADSPAMKILVVVTVTIAGGTNIAVALQGAVDNGSGAPSGTYTTMTTGATVTETNLIAGCRLLDQDMPRPVPTQALPRFLRLLYINSGTHNAGKLEGCLVLDRHDQPLQSNAVLGGYPAGITIAN